MFDYTVRDQQLDAWKDSLFNPLKDRIFGGVLTGGQFLGDDDAQDEYGRPYHQWHYGSANKAARHHHFQITLCTQQSSLSDWMQTIETTQKAVNWSKDRTASQNWWKQYMNRCYFETDDDDDELGSALFNVTLFRYMLGCKWIAPVWQTLRRASSSRRPTFANGEEEHSPHKTNASSIGGC